MCALAPSLLNGPGGGATCAVCCGCAVRCPDGRAMRARTGFFFGEVTVICGSWPDVPALLGVCPAGAGAVELGSPGGAEAACACARPMGPGPMLPSPVESLDQRITARIAKCLVACRVVLTHAPIVFRQQQKPCCRSNANSGVIKLGHADYSIEFNKIRVIQLIDLNN